MFVEILFYGSIMQCNVYFKFFHSCLNCNSLKSRKKTTNTRIHVKKKIKCTNKLLNLTKLSILYNGAKLIFILYKTKICKI